MQFHDEKILNLLINFIYSINHYATHPPSTFNAAPLISVAAEDEKNKTSSPICSGATALTEGYFSSNSLTLASSKLI